MELDRAHAEDEVRAWFRAHGWDASRESWYDEEGVEAWRWTHAERAEEFADMGFWDEDPPVTEQMLAYMQAHR